ncbi:MAG: endonuclease MutS2 [Candidatus Borkfalkiaceae bacterium]|nr:endonuclease MutS2 [Christensenellaceae bacterium]
MDEKVLRTLEFDKVKNKIAEYCVLYSSKDEMNALVPFTEYKSAKNELNKTKEAFELLYTDGVSGVEFYDDLGDSLNRAAKGATLSMGELLKAARLLKSSSVLYSSVTGAKSQSEILKSEVSGVYVDAYLENEIRSKILSDDTMSDNASEKLAFLRKKVKSLNEQIREKLLSYIRNGNNKYLQENIITVRGDRYVLPVKSECRGQVSGFIHDQSSTGSTVFIEPTAVFELNNALKTAVFEEQAEVERILADLSQKVGVIAPRLIVNDEIIKNFDVYYAKAIYAYKNKCVEPQLNADGIIDIKEGRHPLIDAKKVVPVSVSLGEKYNYLLVTGPNTGGKTVTLKLTGLFTLMAASGMFIPAAVGSKLSVFENVFCDVGDEQSIEQSLSTFSSHMKNLIKITENIDENSIVLIDEIGAGTDPDEGSALARAVIEKLVAANSKGIITTHYSALKEYAYTEKKLENASMEFNAETFAPLYRLNIGLPGTSNAIEMSKMLGLDESITSRAFDLLGTEKVGFENVLKEAEKTRRECEESKIEIDALKQKERDVLAEIEKERARLNEEKEKFYAKAKSESRKIVNEKLEEADEIINEIKVLFDKEELTSGDLIKARTLRNKLENKKYDSEDSEENIVNYVPVDPEKLKPGDKVYYKGVQGVCTVHSVSAKKGECEIFMGAIRTKVPVKDLFFVSKGVKTPKTTVSLKREAVMPQTEVNVIGMNVPDALEEVSRFLDASILNNMEEVKIVHGKGMKILSSAIHDYLKKNKQVVSYRFGKYGEGEHGVTFVKLK